jgi:hypothetical protein
MKRISRDESRFDLMRLLDRYARSRGVSIQDHASHADFLADLTRDFKENRTNEVLIHGLRIQEMFAYIAAALGSCAAIKEEDAGCFYAVDSDIRSPDFRIVTAEQREIFVEVKNHRPSNPCENFLLKATYLDSLRKYAVLFQRELYIAIYWSVWRLWSLVHADRFDRSGEDYLLSLSDALKRSEMMLLGDCTLGTIPPLTLRLLSDPTTDRRVGADGKAAFTMGKVELLAAGQVIEDPLEKKIAWFLLNHGDWPATPPTAEIDGGELISVRSEAQPEDRANPAQRFEIIGIMSQMLSRQYNNMTSTDGRVNLLIPKSDPDSLGVMIPSDFKGQQLHLWHFTQMPSFPET